jgi:hypothetical protein
MLFCHRSRQSLNKRFKTKVRIAPDVGIDGFDLTQTNFILDPNIDLISHKIFTFFSFITQKL